MVGRADDPFAGPERRAAHPAAQRVAASDGLGWQHAHVSVWEEVARAEDVTMPSSSSHRIVLVTHGRYVIESRRGAHWQRALYGPGSLGLSVAHSTNTLRWRSATPDQLRSVHVYLDVAVVEEASAALSARGAHAFPDTLQLDDPYVQAGVRDLAWALRIGAPPLYADASAVVLAARLVTAAAPVRHAAGRPGLDAKVLARVVDYLQASFGEPVTLDDLAAVASLSKHHLLRQFTVSTGLTPHQFLRRIRMEHAERLLAQRNLPVRSVARVCGYASERQFSAAFARHAGMTPARWRSQVRAAG